VRKSVLIYLKNRAEFYLELQRKLPHEKMRSLIGSAAGSSETDAALSEAVELLPETIPEDPFLSVLILRDALKKPAYGQNLARTTISWEEALERCAALEETGIVLFEGLCRAGLDGAGVFEKEAARRRETFAALLKIEDDFRYHKMNLLDS
jgi:hypothetical protein